MKKLLIFLIIPFSIFGQNPIRQYKFASRQSSLFTNIVTISPSGNLLLATFSDFNKTTLYELINLRDGKILSKGSLEQKPFSIAWSEDDKLVAMGFIGKPPGCYDATAGMKKIFNCKEEGEIAFTKNSSLLSLKKEPIFLYVFASEHIYKYSDKGMLVSTFDTEEFNIFSYVWYQSQSKTFKLIADTDEEVISYGTDGIKKSPLAFTDIELPDNQKTDKDGVLYLSNDKDALLIYNTVTGNKISKSGFKEIRAVAFTPDSKSILVKTPDSLYLLNLNGTITNRLKFDIYCFNLFYTAFGTELVCVNTEGVDIYACKNYLPFAESKPVPEIKTPPPPIVVKQKPVTPPVIVPPTEKWNLPYTMTDFIVPFQKDSFYLYSPDGKLRNCIIYKKREGTSLWANTYSYYHYFGFSNEMKFAQATIHILELTNSEAIIRTYSKSGIIEKPTMLGLLGYLAKIPLEAGKTTSWPMKIYADDQYTLSAKIIDYTYRGKKDKCLTVTREDIVNGKISKEVNFYQKGLGLIKTEVNGNIAYQR